MITKLSQWCRQYARDLLTLPDDIAQAKMLTAKLLIQQTRSRGILADIQEAEFKVFSQFGEDGILQYLIDQAGITPSQHSFVEFGVESYQEANTRFLLLNNNWRGLILDGSARHIAQVKASRIYWRHHVTAVAAFIDRDNINDLISNAGFKGEIGLLSIDIDGNDYWVWEALTVVNPIIVVAEYNSVFGPSRAVTVPYDPTFVRSRAHHSHLYWGCSIKALELLAKRKGYALIGSNSAGNNVFFVRQDCLHQLKPLTAEQAYVESHFRESRDAKGRLTYLNGAERFDAIAHLPLIDVADAESLANPS